MRSPWCRAAAPLLLLCAALALLAPATHGQDPPPLATYTLAVVVEADTAPLRPLVDMARATAFVDLTCEADSIRLSNAPLEVRINVTASHAESAVFWTPHEREIDFDRQECLDGHTIQIAVEIDVTLGAGLLAGETVALTAVAAVPSEELEEEASWSHEAALRLDHGARLERETWRTLPGAVIQIPGTFDNRGNAELDLLFSLESGSVGRHAVVLPSTLQAVPYSDTPFEIEVTIDDARPTQDREDTLTVRIDPTVRGDPAVAAEPAVVTAKVLLDGKGPTRDSPPGPFLLAVLGAIVLLWNRRH